MKVSRRAKRMERHHKRSKNVVAFNMISLMDIFTILVFFLLINSSNVDLPSTKSIKLPESVAEQLPKETITVLVNDSDIVVQGRKVAAVKDVIEGKDEIIEQLQEELRYQAGRSGAALSAGEVFQGNVTILGHKEIPFSLLKRIMVTCSRSSYPNISLAVMKKVQKG